MDVRCAMTLLWRSEAWFSDCDRYRYFLKRVWDEGAPLVAFCMLNPSTADECKNDPTIERCERRAREWGMGGLIVVNLFPIRATDPEVMLAAADPFGPDDPDHAICEAAEMAKIIVCGWGNDGAHCGRGEQVLDMLRRRFASKVRYLRLNKDGSPGHPLFLPYSLWPQPFAAGAAA